MARNNMLSVLELLLHDAYLPCEWGIEWNEQNNYIDLIFQFQLPNPQQLAFSDVSKKIISQDNILYETRLILYNQLLIHVHAPHYIKAVGVDPHTGIEYGELVCIVKYLKHITKSVRLSWADYLKHPVGTYQLQWHEEAYQQMRRQMIDSHRYSNMRVYFPE